MTALEPHDLSLLGKLRAMLTSRLSGTLVVQPPPITTVVAGQVTVALALKQVWTPR